MSIELIQVANMISSLICFPKSSSCNPLLFTFSEIMIDTHNMIFCDRIIPGFNDFALSVDIVKTELEFWEMRIYIFINVFWNRNCLYAIIS